MNNDRGARIAAWIILAVLAFFVTSTLAVLWWRWLF